MLQELPLAMIWAIQEAALERYVALRVVPHDEEQLQELAVLALDSADELHRRDEIADLVRARFADRPPLQG